MLLIACELFGNCLVLDPNLSPALTDMELSLRRMSPVWARLSPVWLRDGVQAPPRHGGFKDGRRSDAATGEGSAGQDVSFLSGFLDATLSTDGDFERVLGFAGDIKLGWGNEATSAILVWGVLGESVVLLSKLLTEGDLETVLGFVGDAISVLGREATSAILFWGIADISVIDLFSRLSIDGDFVKVFGLDGSTTFSILVWGDPGNPPIECLNSFLSALSRDGDFVIIFGFDGESIFVFDTEFSLFILFLVGNLSPEGDFEVDFESGFAPEVEVSILVWGKSKQFGLPVDSDVFLSIDATLLSVLELGPRHFVPWVTEAAMLVWVTKGSSLLVILSSLITEVFLFVESVKM